MQGNGSLTSSQVGIAIGVIVAIIVVAVILTVLLCFTVNGCPGYGAAVG